MDDICCEVQRILTDYIYMSINNHGITGIAYIHNDCIWVIIFTLVVSDKRFTVSVYSSHEMHVCFFLLFSELSYREGCLYFLPILFIVGIFLSTADAQVYITDSSLARTMSSLK